MESARTQIGGLGNLLFKEAYIYAQVRRGNIPDLYLQDENYFKEFKGEIRGRFGQNITYIPKVAVHVRRGDYVNNPYYVDLFEDGYYQRAMAKFAAPFLVFSDDIDWCKKQEIFQDCTFSEGKSEVDDLNSFASCADHIIANSSFSWWGAYLSPHKGLTVAPKNWFSDGYQRTKLPVEWLQV